MGLIVIPSCSFYGESELIGKDKMRIKNIRRKTQLLIAVYSIFILTETAILILCIISFFQYYYEIAGLILLSPFWIAYLVKIVKFYVKNYFIVKETYRVNQDYKSYFWTVRLIIRVMICFLCFPLFSKLEELGYIATKVDMTGLPFNNLNEFLQSSSQVEVTDGRVAFYMRALLGWVLMFDFFTIRHFSYKKIEKSPTAVHFSQYKRKVITFMILMGLPIIFNSVILIKCAKAFYPQYYFEFKELLGLIVCISVHFLLILSLYIRLSIFLATTSYKRLCRFWWLNVFSWVISIAVVCFRQFIDQEPAPAPYEACPSCGYFSGEGVAYVSSMEKNISTWESEDKIGEIRGENISIDVYKQSIHSSESYTANYVDHYTCGRCGRSWTGHRESWISGLSPLEALLRK